MMGIGMVFSLAILGVIVWGIITTVNWVAAQ